MKILEKIKAWYKGLPDKKRYFEFISAALTIPVMLTVLWSNLSSLKQKNALPSPVPTITPQSKENVQVIIVSSPTPEEKLLATPSPTTACKEEIGPVSISRPLENEVISQNPVMVEIDYPNDIYCDIVWSYRINNDPWSKYTNRETSLYDLAEGDKTLEVKVKSTVSDKEITLRRNFTVEANSVEATSSASGSLN